MKQARQQWVVLVKVCGRHAQAAAAKYNIQVRRFEGGMAGNSAGERQAEGRNTARLLPAEVLLRTKGIGWRVMGVCARNARYVICVAQCAARGCAPTNKAGNAGVTRARVRSNTGCVIMRLGEDRCSQEENAMEDRVWAGDVVNGM